MNRSSQAPSSTDIHVLIVDDDPGQRSLLGSFLTTQGMDVVTASSGEQALQLLDSHPIHMMISDVRMPGISGLEALHQAREKHPHLPVLMVTAFADIRDAVKAMQDGAVNYLEKPIDLDELLHSVRKAVGLTDRVSLALPDPLALPSGVVAESPQTRRVFQEAALVADSDSRILITGESGVGKEVLADVIHAWSPRRDRPILKVNCASIPNELMESELFGHEKGAYTGAVNQRVGRFEEADGGTLLLDEVAEMSTALQAKLLRVVQDGTFQRIGSNTVRQVNVRVLAATHRNLEAEVQSGRFREDLFFRLSVIEIYMPPLRERKEDIHPLAGRFAVEFSKGAPRLSASIIKYLEQYSWPGNIRELRNAIERATLMARGDLIIPEHLPKRILDFFKQSDDALLNPQSQRMDEVERDTILSTLKKNQFNRTETARVLGISRRALTYKLQQYAQQGFPIYPEDVSG